MCFTYIKNLMISASRIYALFEHLMLKSYYMVVHICTANIVQIGVHIHFGRMNQNCCKLLCVAARVSLLDVNTTFIVVL